MDSNMDLINDAFGGSLTFNDDDDLDIDLKQNKFYYIGKAESILSKLNDDNYYEYMKVFSKRFNLLDDNQKKIISDIMGIQEKEKIIIKEKIIYKKDNKSKKPQLNRNSDDY